MAAAPAGGIIHGFLERDADAWQAATHHPFLTACADGSIQPAQFNRWLVQDYLFVTSFTRLAASVLRLAPVAHFEVILGGLAALRDELSWFRDKAQERGLQLDTTPQHPTCTTYCRLMDSLHSDSYAVQAAAFWAIEYAYNQGWQSAGPMPEPYAEFAERWGSRDFSAYVKQLCEQADDALQQALQEDRERARECCLRVAKLEVDFWQMALDAD